MQDRVRAEEAPRAARPARAPAPAAQSAAARMLALQRAAGNRAAVAELRRWPSWWPFGKKKPAGPRADKHPYPATVDIGAEKVVVNSEAERQDAERIVKELPEKYGISVDSARSAKILKDDAPKAPADLIAKVKTWPWLYKELRAVEKAIKHYAPVLGKARASSTRKDVDQEVVSVGKAEAPLRYDPAKKEWFFKGSVMGTYYDNTPQQLAFTMYKHGETATPDYADIDKQMEATATHELAHGIFKSAYPAWVTEFKYWLDINTASGAKDAEAPPTSYGTTNAREDLAESVMFYFVDPERLKKGSGAAAGKPGNPCPLRYAFIEKLVAGWTPAPAPSPKPAEVTK
jgi:hypothetical protein